METFLPSSVVLLLLFASGASGLQLFNIQPANIVLGITPRLDLKCSFTFGAGDNVSTLVSLFISRSNDPEYTVYQEIASINTFSGHLVDISHGNASLSGVINNGSGESFISMQWRFPGQQETGLYKCVANGVDAAGHPLSVTSTSEVTSEQPSIGTMIEAIRVLNIKASHALDNICISDCWQTRLDQMSHARFDVSNVYKGRRYLLSKFDRGVSSPLAEESCELYGGYLAEFDDNDELLFVQGFLRANSVAGYKMVRVGGTDEGHEGTWVYQRNNKPMAFTKWMPGEPDGIPLDDCVYLWSDHEWLMDDSRCSFYDSNYNPRYLCEVPV
ncbi:unnamed protein product [Lymnaea stagnalis]|uniref:C-type lectin domain-containing protein n=1 Tax=Lymnaea stagnalis TaxID=6523 RepID=A0AAV2II88_LYMST